MNARNRKEELLVVIGFTLFSAFLAFVSAYENWNPLMIPIIGIQIAYVWWSYITQHLQYNRRAFLVALIICFDMLFYGIRAETFAVTIPTLCVCTLLLSVYRLRSTMRLNIIMITTVALYHLFVAQSFNELETSLQLNRTGLQILSLLVLIWLCNHLIRHIQEIEEELITQKQKAEQMQVIKEDFMANASHELRTPINTISGMSDILLNENLPENIHNDVMNINLTAIELKDIVSDIIDYAALESDSLTLAPRAYNITSTINDIMNVTVFQNRDKNLELIFDCDLRIPCSLYGDEQQLRRIINNLIGNAIKFTSEGGVTITINSRAEDYGINLIVSVKDTGIGLSNEEVEQIFQMFYQADSKRNRSVEGFGLGLTISSALIKKMGGFLNVKSKVGQGSEFFFSIPQKVLDDRPCVVLPSPDAVRVIWFFNADKSNQLVRDSYINHIRHISKYLGVYIHRVGTLKGLKRILPQSGFTHLIMGYGEYKEDSSFFNETAEKMKTVIIADREQAVKCSNKIHIIYKPYNAKTLADLFSGEDIITSGGRDSLINSFIAPDAKILVVDDNIMNLKVVEGLMRRYRIKITGASSGESALSQIEARCYDLVFMDHMMPGMDGIECLHRIRAKHGSYFTDVPIVALTANAITGAKEMFLSEGFDDFIAKPIDNSLLHQVLEKYIPAYKQLPVPEEEEKEEKQSPAQQQKAPQATLQDFANMPGIDMTSALAYCGGLNDYIELAKVYCSEGISNYDSIAKFYEAKDWKNYSIAVHALKSTSATIGANKLSELAQKEEFASKNGDEASIEKYHQTMMEEYKRVLDTLQSNPAISTKKNKATTGNLRPLTNEELNEIKATLKTLIETFESDAVEDYLNKWADRSCNGHDFAEFTEPILAKIGKFDFTGAAEELAKLAKIEVTEKTGESHGQ